jgi:LemA protein
LVETVKGYAAHERGTLDAVISARSKAMSANGPAGSAAAEAGLSGTLKSLFALGEAYPDLKANQNFLALQEELSSTESKIAYARQYYNDEVRTYNTKVQSFPTNLIANQFKFVEREYYEAEESERGPVKVTF